nr:U18_MYRTX_Mru1d [Myrmica ruginodis]
MKNNRTNTFIIYLMVTFSLISIISITECTPNHDPCPPQYAEALCLNGGTCFTVTIMGSDNYNCICAPGFQGWRCQEKSLDHPVNQ